MGQLETGSGRRSELASANARRQEGRERLDVYETVTNRILERIEQGVVPWLARSMPRVGWPRNFSTGMTYRGINVFLLGAQSFQSPHFLTFLQAKEFGGCGRKGEHRSPIINVETWSQNDSETEAESAEVERRKFFNQYTVFNACQIEGIQPWDLKQAAGRSLPQSVIPVAN